ncbi:MAG: hypothetical protein U0790_00215 [Isosphaeraceae bacterium]
MPRKFPRLGDGDELEPWHLNVGYRELERWSRLQGTGGIHVSHGDPPLVSLVPYETIILVRTPAGGVPARNAGTGVWGSATVTLYDDGHDVSGNPKSTLGTTTETAYNKGPNATPGSKDAYAYRDLLGRLIILVAYC